jgi:hypothetical protein
MPTDSSTEAQTTSSLRNLRFWSYAVILSVGFVRLWIGRYSMNPDGMCYLDLGDAFFHRKWFDAVNGYWSPLYSWLLGAALFATTPSRWSEFPIAHAVNFVVYIAALLSFEFFLRSLSDHQQSDLRSGNPDHASALSDRTLFALGYSLFLWSSLELITIWDLSPDLCVAGFVYLIAGFLLRIRQHTSPKLCATLGIVLGFAYLTKAVMFPLGFAFILIGLLSVPREKKLGFLLLVTFCFLAVSAPWVIALSRAKGRFTFGDSGRLNYSALVSPGGRLLNWQGEPPGSGVPVHTTRQIFSNPPVYEFAEPVGGTYPPSFDPSYWDEGRKWTFNARTQLSILKEHGLSYAELLLRSQAGLLAGALTLILAGGIATRKGILANWSLFGMCVAAMGLYALVHVETRFVGAYVSIFWMTILFGARLPNSDGQRKMAEYMALAVVATILLSVGDSTLRAVRAGNPYSAVEQIVVADNLEKFGLHAGERVAVLGDGNWSYWARSGKLKFVASVMAGDVPAFWATTRDRREEIYRLLARAAARAVVTTGPIHPDAGEGWQQIGATEYYVRWLSSGDGSR